MGRGPGREGLSPETCRLKFSEEMRRDRKALQTVIRIVLNGGGVPTRVANALHDPRENELISVLLVLVRRTLKLTWSRLLAQVPIDSSESRAVQPKLAFNPLQQVSHRGSTQDPVGVVVSFRRKEEGGVKHET